MLAAVTSQLMASLYVNVSFGVTDGPRAYVSLRRADGSDAEAAKPS